METKELNNLIKLSKEEIFDYITKNLDKENTIIDYLKIKDKTKFIAVSALLKSYKLNDRGSAALKKDFLENLGKDNAVSIINVEKIKANPNQPRKIFDLEKLQELSESIKTHGLLQPVVVVDNYDGTFTLIAGERRLRAHLLANIDAIKAIVVDKNEKQRAELALIENIHRQDLLPIEEGITYQGLVELNGYSYRDLENIVFKDKNYIAARINLTKFDDDCIDFILKHGLKNTSKMLKILKAEHTVHKMLLEKLSKRELTEEEIESFYVENIKKIPDEKIKEKKSSKQNDISHDKFEDNPDFTSDKKEAVVEAISEKIRNEENSDNSTKNFDIEKAKLVEESEAFIIKELESVINITLDKNKMTGKDLITILEYLKKI